jgi:tetratricopeptide (TPR) repeat protein
MAAGAGIDFALGQSGDTGDGMETMTATETNNEQRITSNEKHGIGLMVQLLVISCSLLAISFRYAQASPSQLKEGNRLFKNGHYDDALKLYQDALIDTPYSSILQFNAGDAQYQMGDFPKSEVSFIESAKSSNPLLRGASHYNRGNALFQEGHWAEAIDAYKDSLRANPRDEDAKYNLGVAMRALKNPPPPKQGQGKGQEDQKQGKGGQEKNQDQQSGNGQPKSGQMSKEDAERLLAAAGSGEQKKSNQKMTKGDVPHPDEDW